MRFLRRTLVGMFLLSVTVGLLAYAGSSFYGSVQERLAREDRVRPARERVLAVNVVAYQPQEITPVLSVFGEIQSSRLLEIRAPASGQMTELAEGFADGAQVTAGQLLLRIDPSAARSARDVAITTLREAEAEVRDAARALEIARDEVQAARDQVDLRAQALTRQEDLLERGVGAAQGVETAALALSSAEQAVLSRRQAAAQAEARVDLSATRLDRVRIDMAEAERALAETELRAEFSGILDNTSAVKGRLANANEQLAMLIDTTALEVAFRVSTSQYARLLDASGSLLQAEVRVSLEVLGADLEATGIIVRESAAVGEGLTGRLLFARLEAPRGFRPGDFVTVEVAEPPLERVALLPATSVNSASLVLSVNGDERLEEIPVQILRRQGDDILVRSRDLAGREVVAERTPLLGAGIKVRALRPGGAQEPEAPAFVELTAERRAALVAFVEGNQRMPADAKARILGQLKEDRVPAGVVERIESRMGG